MMNGMLNAMKAQSIMAQGGRATVRLGLVSSYDPANYACKVRIQPDDVETGWLPISSPWIGNNWGFFAPPTIGDMVEVQYQEADKEVGFVCGRFYNDSDRPLSVTGGEIWIFHKTGSFFKLTNDGKLLVNGNLEIDATAPTINITATGAVNVTAGTTATVKAPSIILQNLGTSLKKLCTDVFMTLYNGHTHNDPQGGVSAVPNQQAAIGTHTTNIVQAE